jgi:hypothetical protein
MLAALSTSDSGGAMSRPRNARVVLFRVVAVVAALFYGNALTLLPVPWTAVPVVRPGVPPADLRWGLALMGASTGLVLTGTLLALSVRPLTQPLLIQSLAVGVVLDACLEVPHRGPAYLLLALPAVAVIAACPRPRALLEARPAQRLRLPFVILGVVAGMILLVRTGFAAWQQVEVGGLGDGGWIDDAAHTAGPAVAALLVVTGRPGWRVLAALVGGALCYLGVVSMVLTAAEGSWGPLWGPLACAAGVAYVAAAVAGTRLVVPAEPRPVKAAVPARGD